MNARLVTVVLVLSGALAHAQSFQPGQRLILWDGILRGSPRAMGLSGSLLGISEGAEGMIRNPASVAAKDPHFENDFNVDIGGTMHFLFPGSTAAQDWDNDGLPEQAQGPIANLGTQVFYSAIALQWKAVGFGVGVDLQNFLSKTTRPGETFERYYNVSLIHLFGSFGVSLWKDQILLGAGLESTHALVFYGEQQPGQFLASPKDSMGYHGWGVQFGGVWRPEEQDYRVAFSFKPGASGGPFKPRPDFNGFVPFDAIVSPARLSLGGAVALGSGRHLNITSPGGWESLPAEGAVDGKLKESEEVSAAMMKWLLTAQLDIFLPVANAGSVAAWLQQGNAVNALPAGERTSFLMRLGVEKEVFRDRLRLRGGAYFEPPLTSTGPVLRPHVTVGFELYLFKLGRQRMSFAISFDFASLYQNLSFAVLTWK